MQRQVHQEIQNKVKDTSDMEHLTVFAKQLRQNMTDAEKKLWRHLRAKQLLGVKFRRQQPIGGYIADFYCPEKKLVIELDGGQHIESEADKSRDVFMEKAGIRVIRLWNNDVLTNINGVLEYILYALENRVVSYRYFKKNQELKRNL